MNEHHVFEDSEVGPLARLADRRCPRCDAVQPVFVRTGIILRDERKPEDLLRCPGCGILISLAPASQPGLKTVLFLLAGIVLLFVLVGLMLFLDSIGLTEGWISAVLILVTFAGAYGMFAVNALAVQDRHVLVHEPPKAAKDNGS